MNKIEAVLFDAGGVLHENNSVVTDDLASELGLTPKTLQKIWAKQIPLLGSGKIDEVEFWQQVSSDYGIRKVAVTENLLGRAFAEVLQPHTPVLELVQELGASGIKLAVLSNTIEPHARALRDAGLYDDFNHLFLSYEIGMRKPDPAMYEYALETLGTKPETTAYIDDDPENIEAAAALGIHGIVFIDSEQAVADVHSLALGEHRP